MSGAITLKAAQEIAEALDIEQPGQNDYCVPWLSEALLTMAKRIVELEKEVKELKQSN